MGNCFAGVQKEATAQLSSQNTQASLPEVTCVKESEMVPTIQPQAIEVSDAYDIDELREEAKLTLQRASASGNLTKALAEILPEILVLPVAKHSVEEPVTVMEKEAVIEELQKEGASSMGSYPSFTELAEGLYLNIALKLDASCLCTTDATCHALRALNRATMGPWHTLGAKTFQGVVSEQHGLFEQLGLFQGARIDWKDRFRRYTVPNNIRYSTTSTSVWHSTTKDAYFGYHLRTDFLNNASNHGIYLEVEVSVNLVCPSMDVRAWMSREAVQEWRFSISDGHAYVDFDPGQGRVTRGRMSQEAPRRSKFEEFEDTQPLSTLPPGRHVRRHPVSFMGLYLYSGSLAFFRRCMTNVTEPAIEFGPWETTGFVSDLTWAEGRLLTPMVSVRYYELPDSTVKYSVKILKVGTEPPLVVGRPSTKSLNNVRWSDLRNPNR